MHRPTRSLAAVLALVAVTACAPSGDDVTGSAPDRPTTSEGVEAGAETTATTSGSADTTSSSSPTTVATDESMPDPDRPMAPDVSLELADGSTFVLSEEARPVFLVFWAEW